MEPKESLEAKSKDRQKREAVKGKKQRRTCIKMEHTYDEPIGLSKEKTKEERPIDWHHIA